MPELWEARRTLRSAIVRYRVGVSETSVLIFRSTHSPFAAKVSAMSLRFEIKWLVCVLATGYVASVCSVVGLGVASPRCSSFARLRFLMEVLSFRQLSMCLAVPSVRGRTPSDPHKFERILETSFCIGEVLMDARYRQQLPGHNWD